MGKIRSLSDNSKEQQQPQSINLKADDLDDIVCENCDGQIFREASMFKRLSALLSPTGKEQIVPIPIFRCDDCGHINEAFLPKSLKDKA